MPGFRLLRMTALLGCLGLGACAEQWTKPGASPQDFQAMQASCVSEGFTRFPAALRQIQVAPAYQTPVVMQCTYYQGCFPVGGQYVPPAMAVIDGNQAPRDMAVRSCFFANGWQPVH